MKTIEELEQEKNELWDKYIDIRTKIADLKVQDLKDKYLHKYIIYTELCKDRAEELTYMFITNIWESKTDNRIYIEGDYLKYYFCEYDDTTDFYWTPWNQIFVSATDAHNEKWQEEHFQIIEEEEYKMAFNAGVKLLQDRFNKDYEE